MALIKSISGIRGTIGGSAEAGLTPQNIVSYVSAFATLIRQQCPDHRGPVIIGRDARVSGFMVRQIVTGSLLSMGMDVVDLGLCTTPTVEMAVIGLNASGGIIITASHNPFHWNALKFINDRGEFISAADGELLLTLADKGAFSYTEADKLGTLTHHEGMLEHHIQKILDLPLVDEKAIRDARFTVAVDAINSVGGIAVPALLRALGVDDIVEINTHPDGKFAHNPEPLPENLEELSSKVVETKSALGIAVDPDVDRLALVCENGSMFGEEFTLVAVADYILKHRPGPVVTNLSSTRALKEVARSHGQDFHASAVGEVNVVTMMKETGAVIGGEGNGGIILPDLHYGRDALVGIALFLSHLALSGKKCSQLRDTYPDYIISKNRITLSPEMNVDCILQQMKERYSQHPVNEVDGLWIEFGNEWVHLRKSNTEPLIRIYSESDSQAKAEALARKVIEDMKEIIKEQCS